MVMVIGVSAVLAIFMVAAIAFAVGSHRSARNTQDWNSAMAAAYAGIEEYQSRLANDTTYFQYGNPAATFEPASDVTLPTGASTNPAFGVGAGGTWADVAGSNGKASFRYEVDNSKYYADGTLRLRSTGMAGGETRTIVADLKQQGFIDFLYFTDYEIQDPEISGKSVSTCVKYAWAGRPTSGGGCSEIAFGSGDTIKGPLHSNDTLRICQATFQGPVTTSYNPPTGLKYLKQDSNGSGCSGQALLPGYPAYSPVIAMPPTNSQIKREVRSDRPADVPRPGCLYTGPTTIKFNSNGTMTVRSPWTKFTNVKNDTPGPGDGSLNPDCGTPGTGANQLGSTGGQTLTVPENNVIFVQNVPTGATDPNYRSGTPSGLSVSSGANGSNGLGYPISQETTPKGATPARPAYGFKNGDVFVQGTLKGRVTVAAENYIYVTDDVKYGDSSRDILGLIGNNAVWVWNPVRNSTKLLSGSNRRIDAAILSVAHTFQVQNYDTGGDRGTLTVNGAIAQKFRGIVRSGSHGYKKDYNYDNRFRYTAPPKFLSPVTTTYGVNVWVEVSPVMDSDGTYR